LEDRGEGEDGPYGSVYALWYSIDIPFRRGGESMKELKVGCGKPTGSTVGGSSEEKKTTVEEKKEVPMVTVRVGRKAPDFEAPAYQNGQFGQIKLSDYLGKWVALCFYPGDFTFV
jgi:hypothetical protein